MAEAAGFRLFAQHEGELAARRIARFRIDGPCHVAAFIKANGKPLHRRVGPRRGPPCLSLPGPGEVPRGGSMASLATDIDLGKRRGEAIGRRVVGFALPGGEALRPPLVPILFPLATMQDY